MILYSSVGELGLKVVSGSVFVLRYKACKAWWSAWIGIGHDDYECKIMNNGIYGAVLNDVRSIIDFRWFCSEILVIRQHSLRSRGPMQPQFCQKPYLVYALNWPVFLFLSQSKSFLVIELSRLPTPRLHPSRFGAESTYRYIHSLPLCFLHYIGLRGSHNDPLDLIESRLQHFQILLGVFKGHHVDHVTKLPSRGLNNLEHLSVSTV